MTDRERKSSDDKTFKQVDADKLAKLVVLTNSYLNRNQWNSWKKILSEALGENGDAFIRSLFPKKTRRKGAGRPPLTIDRNASRVLSELIDSIDKDASRHELHFIPAGFGLRKISESLKGKDISISYPAVRKALTMEGYRGSCSFIDKNKASPSQMDGYKEQLSHINNETIMHLNNIDPVIMIQLLSWENLGQTSIQKNSLSFDRINYFSAETFSGISSLYNNEPFVFYPYDANSKRLTLPGTRSNHGFIKLEGTTSLFMDVLSSWYNYIGNTFFCPHNNPYIIMDSPDGLSMNPVIARTICNFCTVIEKEIYVSLFPPARYKWGGIRHQTFFYSVYDGFHIEAIISVIGLGKNGELQVKIGDQYKEVLNRELLCNDKIGYHMSKDNEFNFICRI